MKLLLENWNKFINEGLLSRDNFDCQDNQSGFKKYYSIDNDNPPTLEDISSCWANNNNAIYDSSVSWQNPAWYSTEELKKYREYQKSELRRRTEEYEELKEQIKQEGIKEPIIVIFGKNGKIKIGEGNHRHQIALELGIKKIPVRFMFYENVR